MTLERALKFRSIVVALTVFLERRSTVENTGRMNECMGEWGKYVYSREGFVAACVSRAVVTTN